MALQGAGLVKKQRRRGMHRRRRPRRPLPGMLLHIDASKHAWSSNEKFSLFLRNELCSNNLHDFRFEERALSHLDAVRKRFQIITDRSPIARPSGSTSM
jgi:hypothetical protein